MKFADITIDALWVRDPEATPLTGRELRDLHRWLWHSWRRSWLAALWAWLRNDP
jgi:hypothetical protein